MPTMTDATSEIRVRRDMINPFLAKVRVRSLFAKRQTSRFASQEADQLAPRACPRRNVSQNSGIRNLTKVRGTLDTVDGCPRFRSDSGNSEPVAWKSGPPSGFVNFLCMSNIDQRPENACGTIGICPLLTANRKIKPATSMCTYLSGDGRQWQASGFLFR
jgi:hypothetical protein